jgi:spermidine/putrescine transport system substrate-binding protein
MEVIMKKTIAILTVLILSLFTLAGCGKSDENSVYVYNWGEYIDPDVIDMFEEETGIKVEYNEFVTNEDMLPVIQTGSVKYDVVCPSDYMIQKMIEEDLLQEINLENISNYKNIDPIHLESSKEFDPENKYSVPYTWGTLGILYNKSMINTEIDSWASIFDKDFMAQYDYNGSVLMIDSVRDAFAIALTYLGHSLNTTNEAELEEAKVLLQEQFSSVDAYVVDQVRDKMIGGENPIGVIYSGEAIYTQRENPDLEYVVPKEGSNVWIDSWVIPKDAPNKENAEKWIDFMCRPDIALKNFEYITYSTPNEAAWELIEDEEIKNSPIAFPDDSILERCTAFRYLGNEMDEIYMQKWNEVKSQ